MQQEITNEDKNRLLNVDETQYTDYLIQQYRLEPLTIEWDKVSVSDREEMIPAERFPGDFYVEAGGRYPKQVITYHIPFVGQAELFKLQPSQHIVWTTEVVLSNDILSFELVNWRDRPEEIK